MTSNADEPDRVAKSRRRTPVPGFSPLGRDTKRTIQEMSGADSSPRYTLKVTVEERSNPADLATFLRAIPNVKVFIASPADPFHREPQVLFVFPEGDYNVSELFRAIEGRIEQWFTWRTDTVTVEVHRPDGHLQVLAKQKGESA